MGILKQAEEMLGLVKWRRGFWVCELGDQYVTHEIPHYLASALYRRMGCARYEALDLNGRGSITHDLNRPLDKSHRDLVEMFDLVTDFGTGEHVFNQMQVWKTLHQLCRPYGYIAFTRPVEGYQEHAFYLTTPQVFSAIASANDYSIKCLAFEDTKRGRIAHGLFHKGPHNKFQVPQQGRYKSILLQV